MATFVPMPSLAGVVPDVGIPSSSGSIFSKVNLINLLKLQEQLKQKELLGRILAQALSPQAVFGTPETPPKGIPEGSPYEPGPYSITGWQTPQIGLRSLLQMILANPELSLEGKMMGFDLLSKIEKAFPEEEKPIKLSPEQELVSPKGELIYRAAPKEREPKRYILKEGEKLVDEEGNIIAEAKEKPKRITVSPGQSVIDEEGNVIFEMAPKPKAPETRKYHRGGLEITEEWDPQAKKWIKISEAPRVIEKPSDISMERQRRINIYQDAINTTLKKYAPIGEGIVIVGGEFEWGKARNSYEKMKEMAEGGDPTAKRDLVNINHWLSEISKLAGIPMDPRDPLGIRRK